MTHCLPGLAQGIDRFNSPRCAEAVALARREANERRWIQALKAETPLTPR